MIRYRGTGWIPLVLLLQSVAQPVVGDEPSSEYHYSDEWSVVSAPPPAGPYRSVNIDPRVPGAGAVAPLPMNIQPLEAVPATPAESASAEAVDIAPPEQPLETVPAAPAKAASAETVETAPLDQPVEAAAILPEDSMSQPPAAGIAVPLPEPVAPIEAVTDSLQQQPTSRPPPGYYGRAMPPPSYSRQAPMRYPPQAGYPGYRNMPPFGYYNPPAPIQEPEVPPPPQYERQRGYGGMR